MSKRLKIKNGLKNVWVGNWTIVSEHQMVGDLDCRLIHKIAPRPFDASGKLIDTEYQYQCAIMPNLNISAAQACSIQQSQDHWLWYRSAWCWIWKSALKSWNNNLIWFWISIFEDDLCWKCCSAKKNPGSCLLRLRMNGTIEGRGLHLLLESWRKAKKAQPQEPRSKQRQWWSLMIWSGWMEMNSWG